MNSKNNTVNLSDFSPKDFNKGATRLKIVLWYFVNVLFVIPSWNPMKGVKIFLLRLFGAKIGKGVVIKNKVNIKYPWKFVCGDYVWLGEDCWIDNLDNVVIGNNVCISQGALLLTGNHDYTISSMPYRNAPIVIEDGAWIGAKSIVCPGVTVHRNAILTVGSTITKDMQPNKIYQGNPANAIKNRVML